MNMSGTHNQKSQILKLKPTPFMLWVFLFLGLSAPALAAPPADGKQGDVDSYVLCRNEGLVRTIRMDVTKGEGCKAIYTKSGKDAQVGQGRNPDSCKQILNQIRQTLEKNSWTCKDVSKANISGATETSQ